MEKSLLLSALPNRSDKRTNPLFGTDSITMKVHPSQMVLIGKLQEKISVWRKAFIWCQIVSEAHVNTAQFSVLAKTVRRMLDEAILMLTEVDGLMRLSVEIDVYKTFVYTVAYFYDLCVDDQGNFLFSSASLMRLLLQLNQLDFDWSHSLIVEWQNIIGHSLIHWAVYGVLNSKDEYFWIKEIDGDNIWENYVINKEFVPSFITEEFCESLLFIGKSMLVFRDSKLDVSDLEEYITESLSRKFFCGSKWNIVEIEIVLSEISERVSRLLYDTTTVQTDFMYQLKIIKSFMLVSDGEFYRTLIQKSGPLLQAGSTDDNIYNLNSIMQGIFYDKDIMNQSLRNFEFFGDGDEGEVPWSNISLKYTVDFPLNLLLDDKILAKYSTVHKFIFQIHRAKHSLSEIWLHRNEISHTALLLRSSMGFLIDNLLYYFQLNVLDTEYHMLVKQMADVNDYFTVKKYHDDFVDTIMSRCFLHSSPFWNCLTKIFAICENFAALVSHNGINQKEVFNLQSNYDSRVNFLLLIIRGVKYNANVSTLLLLLENAYFKET